MKMAMEILAALSLLSVSAAAQQQTDRSKQR